LSTSRIVDIHDTRFFGSRWGRARHRQPFERVTITG
jgi:hypothetical protein